MEGEISSISGLTVNVLVNTGQLRRWMKHSACGPSVPPGLERVLIIRTRLYGNDVNHVLHLLEFGLPYVKDHFDSGLLAGLGFARQPGSDLFGEFTSPRLSLIIAINNVVLQVKWKAPAGPLASRGRVDQKGEALHAIRSAAYVGSF
jgi:hypothetical protein